MRAVRSAHDGMVRPLPQPLAHGERGRGRSEPCPSGWSALSPNPSRPTPLAQPLSHGDRAADCQLLVRRDGPPFPPIPLPRDREGATCQSLVRWDRPPYRPKPLPSGQGGADCQGIALQPVGGAEGADCQSLVRWDRPPSCPKPLPSGQGGADSLVRQDRPPSVPTPLPLGQEGANGQLLVRRDGPTTPPTRLDRGARIVCVLSVEMVRPLSQPLSDRDRGARIDGSSRLTGLGLGRGSFCGSQRMTPPLRFSGSPKRCRPRPIARGAEGEGLFRCHSA